MKRMLVILAIGLLSISCQSTGSANIENSISIQNDIFAFQFKENIYMGVENNYKNYILEVNTDKIQYSDLGASVIFITDKVNIYQVSITHISYINSISLNDNETELLKKYYNWEKEYQTKNNSANFSDDKMDITIINNKYYLKWTYVPKNIKIDPNSVIESKGYTFISDNYFVTIQMSITNSNNYNEKMNEYETLYNKINIVNSEINEKSILELLNN